METSRYYQEYQKQQFRELKDHLKSQYGRSLVERLDNFTTDNMHFLLDYDRCMTLPSWKGKDMTSFQALANVLGPEYLAETNTLKEFFLTIERNPKMPKRTKNVAMKAWHKKVEILMKKYDANLEHMKLASNQIIHRDDLGELYARSAISDTPLIVLSAGIGDVIKYNLPINAWNSPKIRGLENIHLISNFYEFDADGFVNRKLGKVITSQTKDEGHVKGHKVYGQIKSRPYVLLVGDSLHDADMANGLKHKDVISVAYYNPASSEDRDLYEARFDIVIESNRFKPIVDMFKYIQQKQFYQ